MDENRKNELIKAALDVNYYPDVIIDHKVESNMTKVPLVDVAVLGAAGGPLLNCFNTIKETTKVTGLGKNGGPGIYEITFKKGISGKLAEFHDGSGFLGTVMNENGIASQARINEVSGLNKTVVTKLPYDPVSMAVAVAMISINKKLDDIKEMQKSILDFLSQDKQSKILADLKILTEISENYKYNCNNQKYVDQNMIQVKNIKRDAEANYRFYKLQIENKMNKKKGLHIEVGAKDSYNILQEDFTYYKLSLYLYAYSTFLDVMFLGNFDKAFLDKVTDDVRVYLNQYNEFYTACYDFIEHNSKKSVEHILTGGFAKVNKELGKAIGKVPHLKDAQIDEKLLNFGDDMEKHNQDKQREIMNQFISEKDIGVLTFLDNINIVNDVYNKPKQLYFDEENLYI